MDTQTRNSYTFGFGWSVVIVSLLSAIMVVLKEKNQGLLDWMNAMGHHWITQGVFVIVSFLVLGFILSSVLRQNTAYAKLQAVTLAIVASTVVSGLIIAGFFLL
jgi:hypothetical protein